jgi:hypothetical protein
MCIDLVGTDYIERIHFFGRKFGNAKEALALLQRGRELFLRRSQQPEKHDDDDGLWYAYVPKDVALMRFIDQHHMNSADNSARSNSSGHVPAPQNV